MGKTTVGGVIIPGRLVSSNNLEVDEPDACGGSQEVKASRVAKHGEHRAASGGLVVDRDMKGTLRRAPSGRHMGSADSEVLQFAKDPAHG